jgi:hypothetical protein
MGMLGGGGGAGAGAAGGSSGGFGSALDLFNGSGGGFGAGASGSGGMVGGIGDMAQNMIKNSSGGGGGQGSGQAGSQAEAPKVESNSLEDMMARMQSMAGNAQKNETGLMNIPGIPEYFKKQMSGW